MGRLRAQTDAAGRTTEYSPDVVTGLITRITTPDGRASAFYYNHHNQLTSATGPDGLETHPHSGARDTHACCPSHIRGHGRSRPAAEVLTSFFPSFISNLFLMF
nr:RHS repeat domain-containing protein [Escherichia coli]